MDTETLEHIANSVVSALCERLNDDIFEYAQARGIRHDKAREELSKSGALDRRLWQYIKNTPRCLNAAINEDAFVELAVADAKNKSQKKY